MPSWPARLHLGSSPSSNSPSRPRSSGVKTLHRDQAFGNLYRDSPLHGVPILASSDLIAPSHPHQRPRHGRSHSHPLSSIFSSGRKPDRPSDDDLLDDTLDTSDGGLPVLSARPASRDLMATTNGAPSQAGENDLVTGKCGTCDSLVRWPRHLDVFRCTVCLMVNDLKPSAGPSAVARTAEATNGPATPARTGPSKKGMTDYLITCYFSLTIESSRPAILTNNSKPRRRKPAPLSAATPRTRSETYH